MIVAYFALFATLAGLSGTTTALVSDTVRLEVGSPEVNGRIYAPHAARVRVRVGEGDGRLVAEWTNELTHGDSAGRAVHRWVTKGTRFLPTGDTVQWELRQTYDAVTLAPYGYASRSSAGEERRHADRVLLATWYLTEESPYMVYGEVVLPNGQIQRMTEVAIPAPAR